MPFLREDSLLESGAGQQTKDFVNRMKMAAVAALQEDLKNPGLEEPADAYATRANRIALGVARGGAVEVAIQIYQELLAVVDAHVKETGDHRHRGALVANQAMMNITLKRFDIGIPLLQHVVQVEDPKTYNVAPEDSFANNLRKTQLDDPALDLLMETLAKANFPMGSRPPSKRELESTLDFLGDSTQVLYGVLLGLAHNIRFALQSGINVIYMPLRMFDAFRAYAFFLEELVGRLATVEATRRHLSEPSDPSAIELGKGLKFIFGRQGEERPWWPRLRGELVTTTRQCRGKGVTALSERLETLAESVPASPEDTLVTSLLVLHVVRNAGAHEIYPPAYLVAPEIHLERTLAWLTAAAIMLHREYVSPIE